MADKEKEAGLEQTKEAEQEQPKEFDDILNAIGEFGKWQIVLFFLASLIGIMTAMNTLAQVFYAGESDHWCRVAAWDEANCTGTAKPNDWECLVEKRDASIPLVTDNNGDRVYDSCVMYDVRGETYVPGVNSSFYGIPNTTKCVDADGWVYDTRQYETTIINTFDLVCDESGLVSLAQSIYFAGLLAGSFIFGSLADCLGRKPTIYLATILFLVSTLGNVFSPNMIVYMILRFFVAAGGLGAYLVAYVLVAEFVGPSKRVLVGISIQFFFATGLTILPLLAFLIRTWRFLQLCISVPIALYFLLYFYMPESARWQMSKGKFRPAEKTLRKVAATNKREFPEEMFSPENIATSMEKASSGQQTAVGLFRTPNMRIKTLNIMFNWFVNSLVYYGLGLSTSDLGVDDYMASAIAALVEFPSYVYCIFALQYFGRRINLSGTMVIGGAACITTAFLELGITRTIIAMIGKFCIAGSFAIIYVVSGEIYPTPVRSAGMGLSSVTARIAGIISPFMLELESFWKPLPFVLFGVLSIVAGLLALLLPETNNKKLPETLEEGEEFGKPKCLGGGSEEADDVAMVTVAMSVIDTKQGLDNVAFEEKGTQT
ncbi:organic cation transporter protein-like [Patiria miniata]|uniref:Major facilitator superfamily (MFS) profile domain-containing protein n=1 Tax=Patiria miniata TaxID=46514 RepID=A0A914A805_PATMI|nr:organic cation transporter protein-like [Patiria miniata]